MLRAGLSGFFHSSNDPLINLLVINSKNLAVFKQTRSSEGTVTPFTNGAEIGHEHPNDAGNLGGKSDRDFVLIHSLLQRIGSFYWAISWAIRLCYTK